MIKIIAIKYNDSALKFPISNQLPRQGGSIGSDVNNTIVLPDPIGLLDKRHLLIEPDTQGNYQISNISTVNYLLLNSIPVAQGERRILNQADIISAGGYLLEVRLVAQTPRTSDIDAILDRGGTPALMSDHDPLGIATIEPAVGLADFAENSGELLKNLDQENQPDSSLNALIQNPLTANGNPLLAESSLDPLAIFNAKDDSLENWLAEDIDSRAASRHTLSKRPTSELHIPFSLESLIKNNHAIQPEASFTESEKIKNITQHIPDNFALDKLLIDRSAQPTRPADARGTEGHSEHPKTDAPRVDHAADKSLHALHAALLDGLKLDELPALRNLDADFMRTLGVLLRTVLDVSVRLMAARDGTR